MSGLVGCRCSATWVVLSLLAPAIWAAEPPATESQKLDQALQSTVELDFNEQPLTEVATFLRQKFGIKVHQDEKALLEANVSAETLVTFKIKGISLRSAVRLILRDLDLKLLPRDGQLWITTKDVADDAVVTRVYAVRDLVADSKNPTDVSRFDFNTLIDLIQSSVSPERWNTSGPAPIDRVRAAGALIISVDAEVHEDIDDLLAMLRKARDQQFINGQPKPFAQRDLTPVLTRGATSPAIRKALSETMNVSFDEKPLNEVVESIGKKFGIPVLLDKKSLVEANVSLEMLVSLQAEGMSLRNILRLLLRDLDLKHVIYEEVLLITTKDVADDLTEIRLYPVLDLVETIESEYAAKIRPRFAKHDYYSLIDVIQNIVKPDSWPAGGHGGFERFPAAGVIVIPQVAQVHEDIEELLELLRTSRQQQLTGLQLKPLSERSWQPVAFSSYSPKIAQALNVKVNLNEEKTPLDSLLKFIADKFAISIQIDRKAFSEADVRDDTPVSIHCQGCRLQDALNRFLRPHKMDWVVSNQVLFVTTKDVADDLTVTRGYPISDLDEPDDAWPTERPWARLESLTAAIEINIQPKSWNCCGGMGSTEYIANARTLIVSQSEEVHQEIEAFLTTVRQLRDQQRQVIHVEPNDKTLKTEVYRVPFWLRVSVPNPGDAEPVGLGMMGMGGGGGAGSIPNPSASLVKIIPQEIEPKSWKGAGGQGTIDATEGRLVVRQTPAVHEMIVRFLRGL